MSHSRMRAAAVALALVATTGLTIGLTDTSVSASQKTEITESHPSHPITGEGFYIRGTIATAVERPIELQRKFHDTWKVVAESGTNPAGQFQIQTSTTVNRTYRVVAHSYKTGDLTYKLRKTAAVKVTLADDTVKLAVSPSEVRAGHSAKITITFGATRIGRSLLQETIYNGVREPDNSGPAETGRVMIQGGVLPVDYPKGTYKIRLVALSWHGSTVARSHWVTFKVK